MSLNRQEDKKQEISIDSFLFLLVTEPASNWATTTCTSPLGGRGEAGWLASTPLWESERFIAICWAWWPMPILLVLRRLWKWVGELEAARTTSCKIQAVFIYIVRPCHKAKQSKAKPTKHVSSIPIPAACNVTARAWQLYWMLRTRVNSSWAENKLRKTRIPIPH